MRWEQWTILGTAIAFSLISIILASVSFATTPSETTVTNSQSDLIAAGQIDAQTYHYHSITPESEPLENDIILEDAGNVFQIEQNDPYPGRTTIFSSARGPHKVQASPIELIENTDNLIIRSEQPINMKVHGLTLSNAQIVPANISTSGNKGDNGDVGNTGTIGNTGPKGETCSIKGQPGQKGCTGDQGPYGENSIVDGKDGTKGEKGQVGEKGIIGLDGTEYNIVKIWDTDADRVMDESTNPRPPDFPSVGEYGLVSDDGFIYSSDGLNLTQVDNITTQPIRSEVGIKGTKGEPGIVGDKGSSGQTGVEKGETGYKGYVGPCGTTKGNKGEINDADIVGENGSRGDNGPTGKQGQTGSFSMSQFEAVTQSTLDITRGTPDNQYIFTVYNPVYSSDVPVWGWGRSTLDPVPTNTEIKDNGNITFVQVDSTRHGNANYVNPAPIVYFTYYNNTELSPIITIDPNAKYSVGGSATGIVNGTVYLGLLIDNDSLPREIISVEPSQQTFIFETLLSSSQDYDVVITNTDIPACELTNKQGTIESQSVTNIILTCNETMDTPLINQYIQVNRDASNVTIDGTFSSKANSVNIYINSEFVSHVTLNQDPTTFVWSFVSSFPIETFDLSVELLQNGRVISNISPKMIVILTYDLPPSITNVTPTTEFDVVQGTLTTDADSMEFFTDLGMENQIDGVTTTFDNNHFSSFVPTQYPRGDHAIFSRAKIANYRTSYSWGFSYSNII